MKKGFFGVWWSRGGEKRGSLIEEEVKRTSSFWDIAECLLASVTN